MGGGGGGGLGGATMAVGSAVNELTSVLVATASSEGRESTDAAAREAAST